MRWIPVWMITIAVIHSALAIVLYSSFYAQFAQRGVWGSVTSNDDRLALWFLAAGAMMFLIGYCFLYMSHVPKLAGVILAGIAVVGGVLLPASGFWLILPPALGILIAKPAT
ncbi:MAG: DUF6463 family protein [Pseudomonadota bacterium]